MKKIGKWFILPMYLVIVFVLWQNRETLYAPLAVLRRTAFGDMPLDALFFSIALAGFAVLFRLLQTPPWNVARFNQAVRQAGIANAAGETPLLVSVYRDFERPHGIVYEVKSKGVAIETWDASAPKLEAALGHLYRVEFGRRARTTRLYVISRRYLAPTPITVHDDAIGNTSISKLINLLCVGNTGTGKTVAMKVMLYKFLAYTDAELWIIDVKNQDFLFLSGIAGHYYSHDNAAHGLFDYYAAFKAQQAIGASACPQVLVIDEWAALLLSCPEKKICERCKAILAEILMTGRSYKYFPLIGVQKCYAELFGGGRDNFSATLALGNLSTEAKRMVAGEDAGQLSEKNRTGGGYLLIDGYLPERVRVVIKSVDELDRKIVDLLQRRQAAQIGGEAEWEPPSAPPAAEGGA